MTIQSTPRVFNQSGHISSDASSAETSIEEHSGTCLWIGDHQSRWTRDLFDQCVAKYAQVAVRGNGSDAIDRPCQAVSRILNVRVDSRPWNRDQLELLASRHPAARLMDIRGPLCESFYRFADPIFHDGHRTWLTASGALNVQPTRPPANMVLVVAPDFGTASPLIAAAAAADFSATWVRHPHPECVAGIDEVWWHDAAWNGALSASVEASLKTFSGSSRIRHVLVATGRPDASMTDQFDAVVSLPGSLRCLVGTSRGHAKGSLDTTSRYTTSRYTTSRYTTSRRAA